MSLKAIVSRLGGELYDGGRRANVPAPGHSRADRSVSLRQVGGRLLVHCFGAADWRQVRDHLRALDLLAPAADVLDMETVDKVPTPSAAARRGAAARIWTRGRPLGRSLSARHCRLRGIEGRLPGPEALRHGPSTSVSAYRQDGPTRPALLAAIRDGAGELCAVEITYLAQSGRRDDRLRLSRKTIGIVPPGSAMRLAPPGPGLLVAEGMFTALSASRRFGLPAWALASTSNLRRWRAPGGVEKVLIAADRDAAGEAAAETLRAGLIAQGLEADIVLPPAPFGDWNEAEAAEAGKGWR